MKMAVAVFCDFAHGPLGLRSRLESNLSGRPVIEHTLRRAAAIPSVERRVLVCRPEDESRAAAALASAGLVTMFEVSPSDPGVRPRAPLIQAARKWSIDAWRGQPMGLTWFDEFIDPNVLAMLMGQTHDEYWLCLEGHQAALDPQLCGALVQHAVDRPDEAPYVFMPTPPGLSGLLIGRLAVYDLVQMTIPFGLLLSYRPEIPQPDPITAPVCCAAPPGMQSVRARFLADTDRSIEVLEGAFSEHGQDASAAELCGWVQRQGATRAGRLPLELEFELTTDDPLPETTVRPRGARVMPRAIRDPQEFGALARELAGYDDRLVVLGGHGDPLLSPHFADVCRAIRAAGVYGLAVRTPLVELSDVAMAALMDAPVDILEVLVDAHTAETYARVHGRDVFARVHQNIERVERERTARPQAQPIIIPSMVRCAATLEELEAFYDAGIRTSGAALIHGAGTFGGRLPADTLLPTRSSQRRACGRLSRGLFVTADGRVTTCDQDVAGAQALAVTPADGLASAWQGSELQSLRRAHAEGEVSPQSICASCDQWHRP